MASSNLQINNGVVKDDLNCVKCKSVPKDACLVPCGCRLCCICINDLMESGVEFCPGSSGECGRSSLSQSITHCRTKMNVLKLPTKCPNNWCDHRCQFTNMEEHLRVCPKNRVKCPFREFGCTQDKLAAEEMSDHLQRENVGHNEILIGMINNVINEMEGSKREIVMLKKTDENNKRHFDVLKNADESKNREIEMLKNADESKNREIGMLKKTEEDNKKGIEVLKKNYESHIKRVQLLSKTVQSQKDAGNAQKKANTFPKEQVEALKKKDESYKREIEVLKNMCICNKEKIDKLEKTNENNKKVIDILNRADEHNKKEIELLKQTVKSILPEIEVLKKTNADTLREMKPSTISVTELIKKQNEINKREIGILMSKSNVTKEQIVQENKSMKEDNTFFIFQTKIPEEEITTKIDETRKCGELDSAKLIEYGDQKVNTFKEDIQSINQESQPIKDIRTSLIAQIQDPMRVVDVKYEWAIIGRVRETSPCFCGVLHPYRYQLASYRNMANSWRIFLRVFHEEADKYLPWPFFRTVTISVGYPGNPNPVLTDTRQCQIKKPTNNTFNQCTPFVFSDSQLHNAGLDFIFGLRVTCSISPS